EGDRRAGRKWLGVLQHGDAHPLVGAGDELRRGLDHLELVGWRRRRRRPLLPAPTACGADREPDAGREERTSGEPGVHRRRTYPARMGLQLRVDGRQVEVADDGSSLLGVLRDRLGVRSPKDGCSPQGQCGCCTVLVDGAPRVACVTPARRVADREVTTLDGLPPDITQHWADRFAAAGASQCGFCTPGIIVRLSALTTRTQQTVEQALLAHLCRCTGWRTIVDAGVAGPLEHDPPPR